MKNLYNYLKNWDFDKKALQILHFGTILAVFFCTTVYAAPIPNVVQNLVSGYAGASDVQPTKQTMCEHMVDGDDCKDEDVGAARSQILNHIRYKVEKEANYPVVILGSGVAALTSATYLARGGIKPLVLTGPVIGGAITQSHCVQNWPGEMEISGAELTERMRKQAEAHGAVLLSEIVVAVDFSRRPFVITTRGIFDGEEKVRKITAQACIIALGSMPNLLSVPGEKEYWSRGVYSCAVCDGALYKNKAVAVVGGGDSALTEAQYLSNIASKVYIIVRKDQFRSVEKERAKEVTARSNVEVIFHTVIQEIKGDEDKVTHLVLQDNQSKELSELPIEALFLAIGAKPNTDLFQGQLELDREGYIVLKDNKQGTSVEGVYAVGDIADPEFKQAISAAGDGAKAALQAQKRLTAFQPSAIHDFSSAAIGEPVIEILSKEQFEKEVNNWKGVVFIDFYSTYCGPCRVFSPTYDAWAKEFQGKIKFLKVNAEHAPILFQQFQIRGVPTLVILDGNGQLVRKSVGGLEISLVKRRLDEMKGKPAIESDVFK